VQRNSEDIAYLEQLAGELARRGLSAAVIVKGRRPCVKVANPDTPALNERVFCDQAADGSWCFWWPWRRPIGSADDLGAVAGKIMTVLRSVQGQP
jgi:hypothetical protein